MKVLVSSTTKDLGEAREKVCKQLLQLDIQPVSKDWYGSIPHILLHIDDAKLKECDAFVIIVGHLYGSIPQGEEKSFTELEYEASVVWGKPVYPFLASNKFLQPVELQENDITWQKLKAFRERLEKNHVPRYFDNADQLCTEVTAALSKLHPKDGKSKLSELMKVFKEFLKEEKNIPESALSPKRATVKIRRNIVLNLLAVAGEDGRKVAMIDFSPAENDRGISNSNKRMRKYLVDSKLENCSAYIVCRAKYEKQYLFDIYQVTDTDKPEPISYEGFPTFEELKQMTAGKKLTLSDFKAELDTRGKKIFDKVVDMATSSSIGLDTEITDESYINLRPTGVERKTDNVVIQIHRSGVYEKKIALAVAGTQKGTEQKEPELNDFIIKGNITKLSGYKKGIAGERAWLAGNLPKTGAREKASVYVIDQAISTRHGEALGIVKELLIWAVKNFDKSPTKELDKIQKVGNVATIRIEGIGKLDRLGRDRLVNTLAGMFALTDCDNGFTMALLGDWGQGKSMLMGLLQTELEEKHKAKFKFAKYNAWEYEKAENVSAGIAQEVVKGLTSNIGKCEKILLRFKFAWREHNEKLRRLVIIILSALSLLIISLGIALLFNEMPSWYKIIPAFFGLSAIGLPLLSFKDLKKIFEHPLSTQLQTYLKLPDYGEHLGLIPVLKRHMQTLCTLRLDGKKKLIVFVDDLDRCNVDHIAKVLDAIRLVMTIPNVIVMIGIDHRIAFKAIRKHYKDLADRNESRGSAEIARDYLGKIIQLPVRLRAASHDELKDYVFEYLFDKKNLMDDSAPVEKTKRKDIGEKIPIESDFAKGHVPAKTIGEQGTNEGGKIAAVEREVTEDEINEAIKDKKSERDEFYGLLGKFDFSNPRQLLRLHNSFRFLKGFSHGTGKDYSTLDMLRMLFWQEFLHNWPIRIRGRCMATLIDKVHTEKVEPIARKVLNNVKDDISKLFAEPESYAELAEFVRIVVLPHNEEGIFDTKEEINEWLEKQPEDSPGEIDRNHLTG